VIDPDDPTAREDAPTDPADPPAHAGPDEDAAPAFDIDLEPEDQGTAEAAAEPSG
jgi:hypothetical protein